LAISTTSGSYVAGIQYSGTTLFVQTDEGRVLKSGTNWNYEYTLTDHLGNSRVNFETITGSIVQKQANDHYPFGLSIARGTVPNSKNNYLYNKKELQEELGQYDYGARLYDPVIARWTVVDPKTEAYPNWSSYNYALNNPIKYIDPKGEDVYLLIWGTHDGNIGHVGIAVDNYKTEEVKDKNGKTKLDKHGKAITRQVKTGTVTYYDLWPGGQGAGKSNFDKDIPAAYGGVVTTVDALKNTDVTGSEEGPADRVVKFSTNASTDATVVNGLNAFKEANPSYNGLNCNCSDHAKEVVLYAAPPGASLTNYREKIGSTNATTPNQLLKAASQLENATVIKDPGTKVQKKFIEGVTGGGTRQKVAEKRVN